MLEKLFYFVGGAVFLLLLYFAVKQIFNFLLRGFAPFIIARPWVIKQIMEEIDKMKLKNGSIIYSIGSGRSGLLHALEAKYPKMKYVGVEDTLWTAFSSWLQLKIKRSKIKVVNEKALRRLDISRVDLIYCKLDVERLRDLDKKFKFECKSGARIISNGFIIPNLQTTKIIELDDRKGRLSFLSQNRELWKSKSKKSKKENKVYFYEI